MPSEAETFYKNAITQIRPETVSFIQKKARQLAGHNVNADSLFNFLKKESFLKDAHANGVKSVMILILIECADYAEVQLKKTVMELAKENSHDLNSEATKPLLQQKSELAGLVINLLSEVGKDTSANLSELR